MQSPATAVPRLLSSCALPDQPVYICIYYVHACMYMYTVYTHVHVCVKTKSEGAQIWKQSFNLAAFMHARINNDNFLFVGLWCEMIRVIVFKPALVSLWN